ncbi:MAG: heme-binding protein [SAR324 cluster bacterium]|nr:heme-binding protein [SAR324 cluster bacterium]
MSRRRLFVAAMAAVFFMLSVAPAISLEMRPLLTLDIAEKIALACEIFGEREGYRPLNIAVVDEQGNLIYFRRSRNSFRGSADIAINKAWTSAKFPFSTRFLGEKIVNRDPNVVHGIQFVDRLIVFPGGLPIMAGEHHIGAVGVSGATGDQDEACAQAGIDAVKDLLK